MNLFFPLTVLKPGENKKKSPNITHINFSAKKKLTQKYNVYALQINNENLENTQLTVMLKLNSSRKRYCPPYFSNAVLNQPQINDQLHNLHIYRRSTFYRSFQITSDFFHIRFFYNHCHKTPWCTFIDCSRCVPLFANE